MLATITNFNYDNHGSYNQELLLFNQYYSHLIDLVVYYSYMVDITMVGCYWLFNQWFTISYSDRSGNHQFPRLVLSIIDQGLHCVAHVNHHDSMYVVEPRMLVHHVSSAAELWEILRGGTSWTVDSGT